MFSTFIDNYEHILHNIAEVSALTLEFIGVIIIVIGSVKALVHLGNSLVKHRAINIVIELGKTLALALEFKMGAEIIKTVIVHNLEELAILGVVPRCGRHDERKPCSKVTIDFKEPKGHCLISITKA